MARTIGLSVIGKLKKRVNGQTREPTTIRFGTSLTDSTDNKKLKSGDQKTLKKRSETEKPNE